MNNKMSQRPFGEKWQSLRRRVILTRILVILSKSKRKKQTWRVNVKFIVFFFLSFICKYLKSDIVTDAAVHFYAIHLIESNLATYDWMEWNKAKKKKTETIKEMRYNK